MSFRRSQATPDKKGKGKATSSKASSSKAARKGKESRANGGEGTPDLGGTSSNKIMEVFEVSSDKLNCLSPEENSLCKLFLDIRSGVEKRTTEVKVGKKVNWNLKDKIVMPVTNERFIVRFTNQAKESICYLYNWSDLYYTAYYVDDVNCAANRCWYYTEDNDDSFLPPPSERFPYEQIRGKGTFQLPLSYSYADFGGSNINLGERTIEGYISSLFNIKSQIGKTGKNKRKLMLNPDYLSKLKGGALAFGAVLSEASRFADFQEFMIGNVCEETHVPYGHSQFFTMWSTISAASRDGVLLLDPRGSVILTAAEVQKKLLLLCASIRRESS